MIFRRERVFAASLALVAWGCGPSHAAELGRPGTWDGDFGFGYALPFGGNSKNLNGSFGIDFAAEHQATDWAAWGLELGNETSFPGTHGNNSLSIFNLAPTLKLGETHVSGASVRWRPYVLLGAGFYSLEQVGYASSGGGSFPAGASVPATELGISGGAGVDFQVGSNLLAGFGARAHEIFFSGGGFQMVIPSLWISYLFGGSPRGEIRNHPIQ